MLVSNLKGTGAGQGLDQVGNRSFSWYGRINPVGAREGRCGAWLAWLGGVRQGRLRRAESGCEVHRQPKRYKEAEVESATGRHALDQGRTTADIRDEEYSCLNGRIADRHHFIGCGWFVGRFSRKQNYSIKSIYYGSGGALPPLQCYAWLILLVAVLLANKPHKALNINAVSTMTDGRRISLEWRPAQDIAACSWHPQFGDG